MPHPSARRGLLQRFRRDASGNALAIMAAAVLPMTAAVGGAIDISRNYMAKSRLQQACDAGVLAGRKTQAGNAWGNDAEKDAKAYFAINFPDNTYGAQQVAFTPTANAQSEVTGAATAFVPSTIGKVIGYQGQKLEVDCTARFDLSNTDVMFVLDVTGSMNCPSDGTITCPGGGSNGGKEYGNESGGNPLSTSSRIGALRKAVIDFHDILQTAKPSNVQFRYGFVPYSSSVNVGGLLMAKNSGYVASTAQYQTREWDDGWVSPYIVTRKSDCDTYEGTMYNGRCYWPGQWNYRQKSLDVSGFKAGQLVTTPSRTDGSRSRWSGCIQERETTAQSSFSPIPAAATDLNIDAAPTNDASRWAPLWPEVAYARDAGTTSQLMINYLADYGNDGARYLYRNLGGACPVASDLVKVRTASAVDTFVRSLQADGGTYHDIGMIWGLRLLSPTGLWGGDNSSAPNNLPITRHIIFMTDGQMQPDQWINSAYGVERNDMRVGGGSSDSATLIARHNARFLAVCELAKSQFNVRVWTVAFGTPLSATRLVECADQGRSFEATNASELNDTFRRIATRIADLRLEE